MENKHNRENFGSRFAVIMAMAGSAIGLGNIWRFPYIAGEMGGGAFVLLYVLCTIFFSVPIFMTEVIIGRNSRKSAANAMYKISGGKKFWKAVGVVLALCPLVIMCYYSVVGGWAMDYFFKALVFTYQNTPSSQVSGLFDELISSTWRPIAAHLIFLAMTAWVVSRGVKSGVEKFSTYTVPVLFLMIVAIMVYSFSLPGAKAGINYLLKFDVASFSPRALAYAMGQSFYSLSLGMGTIITYGSYVRKHDNILTSGVNVAVSDLFFALLSAFAIMPAVFAAGLEPGAGPGLIFQTIPYIFSQMGFQAPVLSGIVAILFFLTVLVAALTSSVSLFEVGVAYIVENSKLSRRKASLILFMAIGFVGTICSLGFGPLSEINVAGMGIFDILDWFSSNVLLILASLLATVFAGWVMKKEDFCNELSNNGTIRANSKFAPYLYAIVRYVAPLAIFAIFISNFIL